MHETRLMNDPGRGDSAKVDARGGVSTPGHERMAGLDALRIVAALAVLAFHHTAYFDSIYGHEDNILFNYDPVYGRIGVPTFLILSGFLNVMIARRTASAADWFKSKFIRLFPVYWVAASITFCSVKFFGLPGREIDPVQALVNATMVQEFFHCRSIDGAYWTMRVIVCFYLIMGGLVALRLRRWALPVFAVLTAAHVVNAIFEPLDGFSRHTKFVIEEVLILEYAGYFMMGILIHQLRRGLRVRHLAIVGLYLVSVGCVQEGSRFFVISSLPAVVLVFSRYGNRIFDNGVVRYLATISYAFYLVHQNIGYIIIRQAYEMDLNGNLGVALAALVVFGLASALTFAVERPVARLLTRRFADSKQVANRARGS